MPKNVFDKLHQQCVNLHSCTLSAEQSVKAIINPMSLPNELQVKFSSKRGTLSLLPSSAFSPQLSSGKYKKIIRNINFINEIPDGEKKPSNNHP